MTYFLILSFVVLATALYQARGVIGVILSDARMRAGDYEGALRRLRWTTLGKPNAVILHKQGLILTLAGRPTEAELCYRQALELVDKGSPYPKQRLLASLGYAIIDQARYQEAEQAFQQAIEAGDQTGNSQDGLAELCLVSCAEIEQALAYAQQATEHGKSRALEAWALAILGHREEASVALAEALREPEPNPRTAATLHWRAAMAFLALDQPKEARRHFQSALDLDPNGKYGARSRPHLA